MPKRVLVVCSEGDEWLASGRLQLALDALGCDVEVSGSVARAVEKIDQRDPYDCIIVGMRVANDPTSGIREDGGIAFCRAARVRSTDPIVLVVAAKNNLIDIALHELKPAPLCLAIDEHLLNTLVDLVGRTQAAERRLDVVVFVEPSGGWRYEFHPIGFRWGEKKTRGGKLGLQVATVTAYSNFSKNIESLRPSNQWHDPFKDLGRFLIQSFSESNRVFESELNLGITLAGGLSNTNVTFVVDHANYHMTLEAIFPPNAIPPEPWMISAPVRRNLSGYSATQDLLFEGRRHPLRILIICADTDGTAALTKRPLQTTRLLPLTHARPEAEELFSFLNSLKANDDSPIKEVLLLGHDAPVDRGELFDALRTGTWDVIHYAGHSLYRDDLKDAGFLFVGPQGKPIAVKMKEIGPYLSGSSLVYFSSCESGSGAFAVEAADAGVPSVIGFRWPVSDELAREYSRRFYEDLIRSRNIDRAFLEARRSVHRSHPSETAWASAMLVISGVG